MLKTGITYALLMVLSANSGLTQEPASGPTLTLTMKDAIELALSPDGNVALRIAGESVRIAETRLQQSQAMRRPIVDAYVAEQNRSINLHAMGVRFSPASEQAGLSLPRSVGPFSSLDMRLQARYELLNLSLNRANEAASAEVAVAEAGRDAQRDDVGFRVAGSYLVVLRHKANVEAARASAELSRALIESAEHRESAGLGTAIDVTRMRSQLANDRYRLSAALVELELAELNLLNAMGLSLETTLHLADSLELPEAAQPTVAEAVQRARQMRGDLRVHDKLIAQIRGEDRAIHAERLPTVDVFGDFGAVNADADRPVPTHTVGVAVRVPVFDGGRRAARRAEVNANIRRAELRRGQILEGLELEIEQALRKLRLTRQQVEAAQTGVDLAEDELARARRRYENGMTNSLDVVQAQTRLREARSNHIEALYACNRSRVDLAEAEGDVKSLAEWKS